MEGDSMTIQNIDLIFREGNEKRERERGGGEN